MQLAELTETVIGCAFAVHNTLGSGFLEKVYERALALELRASGLSVVQQAPIAVLYRGEVVGDYYADLLIEGELICEIKAVSQLATEHEVQLVNYLTASEKDFGLLINFGKSVSIKRKYRRSKSASTPVNPLNPVNPV